jgi:hypothetical protein
VVGERLVQGVAEVPAVRQVQAGRLDELALGPQPFEEEDELELEEDHGIEARSTADGVPVADELAHEGQIEHPRQVAVEVVRRHQRLQRGEHRPVDAARLRRPEHRQIPPGPPLAAGPRPHGRRTRHSAPG